MKRRRPCLAALLTLATALPAAAAGQTAGRGLSERVMSWHRHRPALAATDATVAYQAATLYGRAWGGPGEDGGYVVRTFSDGGFVVGGLTSSFGAGGTDLWLVRFNESGSIAWQKTYGTSSADSGMVLDTPDGGYALFGLGETSPGQFLPWIAKLDANGTIQWQKQVGPGQTGFASALLLADGGYLLSGTAFNLSTFTMTFRLMRLNSGGTVVWQKEYPSTKVLAGTPQQLADGSFIVSGTAVDMTSGSADVWVMKLASDGTIQWQKTYGGSDDDLAGLVAPVSGGYLVSAQTQSFGPAGGADTFNLWLLKLDTSGNVLWQRVYGGSGDEFGFPVSAADGILLAGYTDSFGAGAMDTFLAKLDNNGVVQWAKTYGGSQDDMLVPWSDSGGGFLAWGLTQSFGGGGDDVWIVKFDANFNILWQRTYGGSGDDDAGVLRRSDGSLLAVGDTESFGAGLSDLWVLSLDANGLGPAGCQVVRTTSVTGAPFTFASATTTATVGDPAATAVNTSFVVTAASITQGTASATSSDVCTASSTLRATATATPTSGPAPLAVSFTASASGGQPPYTFDWDFGDGSAHSSQQNPTHTYTTAGTYAVTLSVTDAASAVARDSHLSITVSGGGGCTVTCQANVPATATVGTAVAFSATATASGCATSPVYVWTFGDGQGATGQSVSHTYAAPGSYTWHLLVQAGTGTCTASGTITVSTAGQGTVAFIPSVAHAPGAAGTQWRTDVTAVNRSGGSASLTLLFTNYDGTQTLTRTATLANGATVEWRDILVSLFGVSASASTKGTLKVTASAPITLASRTYNQASSGTYGQYYPAITDAAALTTGQLGVIPQLKKNAAFRTNVGVLNPGAATVSVAVKLFNAAGAQVGSTKTFSVPAGRWTQQDDIFANAGAGNQDIAYATVEVQTPGARAWAYASVVDANTGDPTTMPVQPPATATTHFIPSVAHAPGAAGTQWRTDVTAVNRSGGSVSLTLLFTNYDGTQTLTRTATLANGATVEWRDILVSLFGVSASASTKGTLKVTASAPITLASRTYNQASSGTYGQYYPAITDAAALTTGQLGVIPQLKKNAAFRTNVGVLNPGAATVSVAVKLFNAAGAQVGSTKTFSVPAGRWTQQDDIFANAGAGNQDIAYATVEVQTPGARAWAYASVVDANTGDPTTMPVLVP